MLSLFVWLVVLNVDSDFFTFRIPVYILKCSYTVYSLCPLECVEKPKEVMVTGNKCVSYVHSTNV